MLTTVESSPIPAPPVPWSRKNPYLAELTAHDRLTKPGSLKDTRHFVLNLGDSGLTYTPGDSLGAFGHNPPELVDHVLELLGFEASVPVQSLRLGRASLREVLLREYTL